MSHPCLRASVVCSIMQEYGTSGEHALVLAVGRNTCDSALGPQKCARDEMGMDGGEGYDLCGPPEHAEIAALRELDPREIDQGHPLVAEIVGQDWVCRPCMKALFDAGVRTFRVLG